MRTRTGFVAGVLIAAAILSVQAQDAVLEMRKLAQELEKELASEPSLWPALATAAEPTWGAGPLPAPSLTDAFAIGEALYARDRLADAVVSMLALMRVRVVPEANAATQVPGGGLVLSESEVQALIDLGSEDLEASDGMENLPHSFADLHAAVAGWLPGVSVEQLAQAYTRAYEARPNELVAKVLMGQPIMPETKLTRTQIWFLLVDGFVGAAANGAPWGTADREVPDLPSPNPQWSAAEWREVLARLPLVTANRLLAVEKPPVITQGATAGAPVNVSVRPNPTAPPLVSRATGRTLVAARAGSLAGREVTWTVRDESALEEIGSVTSPVAVPVTIGANGIARFVFQPRADPTSGTGQIVDEWDTIAARFQARDLVAGAYGLPAPLARLALGTSRVRANVLLRWRSASVLNLEVNNKYLGVNFQIPGLGGGTRSGKDKVVARLSKRANGTYAGRGVGEVNMSSQVLRGPAGSGCPRAMMITSQAVYIVLKPSQIGAQFHVDQILAAFMWSRPPLRTMADEPPNGAFYSMVVYPVTEPGLPRNSPCIPFIQADYETRMGYGGLNFVPFNDAQWTTAGQGYGILVQAQGTTDYNDFSSSNPLAWPSASVPPSGALGAPGLLQLQAAFQLTGTSIWSIKITR